MVERIVVMSEIRVGEAVATRFDGYNTVAFCRKLLRDNARRPTCANRYDVNFGEYSHELLQKFSDFASMLLWMIVLHRKFFF